VPFLEEEGIIRHIDYFVFENVCAILKDWADKGHPFKISVNFSKLTLTEDDVVDNISSICSRYGVQPEHIDIEVTESISQLPMPTLSDIIQNFTSGGFTLSLDNFGSTYSNLAMLVALDFATVKFDKSLIADITTNEKTQVIISNLINTCNSLPGTCSLAAGVETREQYNLLKLYGCDMAQGFYISKPISTDDFFDAYLKNGIQVKY
jgi:EAL domain-containing protein (putative c-di-GMP-specific phosphodiesterase class I)